MNAINAATQYIHADRVSLDILDKCAIFSHTKRAAILAHTAAVQTCNAAENTYLDILQTHAAAVASCTALHLHHTAEEYDAIQRRFDAAAAVLDAAVTYHTAKVEEERTAENAAYAKRRYLRLALRRSNAQRRAAALYGEYTDAIRRHANTNDTYAAADLLNVWRNYATPRQTAATLTIDTNRTVWG